MSDRPITFWDHLDELRKRILRSFLFVVIGASVGFALARRGREFLMQPFREAVPGTLSLLGPSEGFVIEIKIAILIGLLISTPFVAWQLYGFVGPGLRRKEKLWLWPIVGISTVLFWGGVVFSWMILPTALEFLGSFAEVGLQNFWSLNSYISLVLFLLIAFGVIFQLPLVMGLLIATGLVKSAFFRKHRRIAIVLIFFLAALATPTTDALTMMLMVAPMMVLYEAAIWIGVLLEARRKKTAKA
ncbi:MAG: twin-arginine translocase subunit TatC [Calditrichaeota bacterium]|nr:twin-arginine translocase subunit TatC [Calditrichota bacterium]MCB9365736.1 twin-arginine translocase subunit TatC [Calditrichota bacterium]